MSYKRNVGLLMGFTVIVGGSVLSGCASDGSTSSGGGGGTTTTPGAPTTITSVASPAGTVAAGASAGTYSVKVTDFKGIGVPNVLVSFSVTGSATLNPTSISTDAAGLATTTVTAGTTMGAVVISAAANGLATVLTTNIAVTAAPAAKVVATPKTLRLVAIGDTARVIATAQDQFGNMSAAGAIAYSVNDATLISVDQAGLVRALKLNGTALVIATSNGKADTSTVTVLAAGQNVCTGFATASPLNVGDVQTLTATQYGCFTGTAAGAEFVMVAFNGGTDQVNAVNASVTPTGVGAPPSTSLIANSAVAGLARAGATSSSKSTRDDSFHLDMLRRANVLHAGIIARSRAARSARAERSTIADDATGTTAALGSIPASIKVGDTFLLNVSANDCSSPTLHGVRVQAIGSKSIVLSDTLNPANGFVTTDYQRFAANFDTLVYPVDVNNFGTPVDLDANGRVALVFTRTVNELVDASSGFFVGGFFNPRDIYPKKGATTADDCAGSNEGEMFYLVVPAPAGINGVPHTVGFVDSLVTGIVAHEFQHLINSERRFYVNTTAPSFEDIWLNEGLSHIAEELLYYRQSGLSPRADLNDATIGRSTGNATLYGYFKSDQASNFSRYNAYMRSPSANSPIADNDDLATRGATWSFLRYAADRLGTGDAAIWLKMDNSTSTGLGTLQQALGTDPKPFFRDWAVSNYLDDLGVGSDARYQQLSWNIRSILGVTLTANTAFPLPLVLLNNNTKSDVAVRAQSAAYLRFAVPAGGSALLTLSSGGGVPPATLQFIVVRTK